MHISFLEQIFAHLASDQHMREKAKLEKELEISWNNTRTQQRIPSLLGRWMIDIKE
jgi:hypothetical protein